MVLDINIYAIYIHIRDESEDETQHPKTTNPKQQKRVTHPGPLS